MNRKRIKKALLDIIFTRRCGICGDICNINESLCEGCAEEANRIDGLICYKCGLEKDNCNCRSNRFLFYESICAPFHYRGGAQKAIFRLKFRNRQDLADNLAEEMAKCVRKRYAGYDFDLCTFMPSHTTTLKERGYNQAELLARSLSDKLGIPCHSLIQKDFETPAQHTLPLYKRTGNLAGALSFDESSEIDVKDMRILLCDDIKTSGRSLDECTKILLFKGAAEVRCVTVCIAGSDKVENL